MAICDWHNLTAHAQVHVPYFPIGWFDVNSSTEFWAMGIPQDLIVTVDVGVGYNGLVTGGVLLQFTPGRVPRVHQDASISRLHDRPVWQRGMAKRFGKEVWQSKHCFRNRDLFGERFRSFDQFIQGRKSLRGVF